MPETFKTVRMSLSKNKNHIVFFESEFDEEGLSVGKQRRAALEIVTTPKAPTPEHVFANAMKYKWEIDEEVAPTEEGWYEIVRVGLADEKAPVTINPDELQHS
jgi:hypothetical protein